MISDIVGYLHVLFDDWVQKEGPSPCVIHHRHRFAILNRWKVYYVKVNINMIYVDTKWWKREWSKKDSENWFCKKFHFISCEWVTSIHISTIFDFYTEFCFEKMLTIYNWKKNHFRVESVFRKYEQCMQLKGVFFFKQTRFI